MLFYRNSKRWANVTRLDQLYYVDFFVTGEGVGYNCPTESFFTIGGSST